MSKEFYRVNDIVFGLRDEYQRIEKKLRKLEECSRLAKGFDNLSFEVFYWALFYNYLYKGMFPFSLLRRELLSSSVECKNGRYCSSYPLEITNEELFNTLAKEILEDSFLKNIVYTDSRDCDKRILFIDCSSIVIYPFDFSKIYRVSYKSIDDSISFCGSNFTKEDIEMCLQRPVLVDIPSYHRDIIDKNVNRCNEIDLVLNTKIKKEGTFKIIDESDRFVLQKIKALHK